MTQKMAKLCMGDEAEFCLCSTALSLVPLYSMTEEDRPDALLGAYPARPILRD